jgi:hypothetical protein
MTLDRGRLHTASQKVEVDRTRLSHSDTKEGG